MAKIVKILSEYFKGSKIPSFCCNKNIPELQKNWWFYLKQIADCPNKSNESGERAARGGAK